MDDLRFLASGKSIEEVAINLETTGVLRIQIFKRTKQLHTQGRELIVRWIPSHQGIEGNK